MLAQESNAPVTTIAERPGAELLMPVKDLSPVGYADRRPMPRSKRLIFTAIIIVTTISWAMTTLNRGGTVNATWLVLIAVRTYITGHHFYGRLTECNVVHLRGNRATPAERYSDSRNLMPTDRRVLFGHYFAAIASAGPLVGPIMAAQIGCLSGTIRVVFSMVFVGAVQNYMVLAISTHRKGRSFGQMINDEMGKAGGIFVIVGILVIVITLIAVPGVVIISAFVESSRGVFSIMTIIPITIFMSLYLRYTCPGRVSEVSIVGVVPLMLAIIAGDWVDVDPTQHDIFLQNETALAWVLIGHGFVTSVLPVWLLLAPRDYLSTFVKIDVIGLLVIGITPVSPGIQMPTVTKFTLDGTSPAFVGELSPFLLITIACGALPGFHSLASSDTAPKLVEKESQMCMIGYGGMIMESFVAMMVMCAAVIIDQHFYFTMNVSVALTGGVTDSATAYVNSLDLSPPDTDPAALAAVVQPINEDSIVSRTGDAPTLAFGMSKILSDLFGDGAFEVFWYHFATMLEVLFILTTIDADARVVRFMFADATGNIPGPTKFRDAPRTAGNSTTSAAVHPGWGPILVMGVIDPLGGINMLSPLFGTANQLLVAMTLTLITVVVVKHSLAKWAWIPGLPLVWDLIITMIASWQKIFHGDPVIDYWALHNAFKDTRARGLTEFKMVKTVEGIDAVIRNIVVQGTSSVVFAAVTLMVVSAGVVAIVRALQNGAVSDKGAGTGTEPYVASRYFIPIGPVYINVEKRIEPARAEAPDDGSQQFQGTAHSHVHVRRH